MKKFLTLIAAFLIATSSYAEDKSHCDQMVAFGYPTTTVKITTPLCRISYFVLHDNSKKVPVYSAEWLLPENIPSDPRVNAFKADPDLSPNQRAELSDYNKAYDRGHMTPFEDARENSAAALQTFYLSNMVPQNLHLNRGLWRSIEDHVRKWAVNENGLYVITGPAFTGKPHTIGNGVAVPDYTYKVVIDKHNMQGVAFLVPNTDPKKGDKFDTYIVPISKVEEVTKINFTPLLKDSQFKGIIGKEFSNVH